MLNIEQIRAALRDRKPAIVAAAVGIAYDRVWRIQTSRATYLRESELRALSDYLSAAPTVSSDSK